MERLTRFVLLGHRLAVLCGWLAVLVVSLAAMVSLSDLLTNRFTLPNTDTARAEDLLEDRRAKSTGSFTLVVEALGPGEKVVPAVQAAAARAAAELPTRSRVATACSRSRRTSSRR